MTVFDVIVNNADRKGTRILAMPGGHRYGVDHGLTFHVDNKLRTVMRGWLGETLSEEECDGVGRVLDALEGGMVSGLRSCSVPRKSKSLPTGARHCSTTGSSRHRAG